MKRDPEQRNRPPPTPSRPSVQHADSDAPSTATRCLDATRSPSSPRTYRYRCRGPRSDVAAVSWQNQRTLTDRDPATGEPIRWRALGQKRDVARDVAAHGQFPVKAVAETLGTLDLV